MKFLYIIFYVHYTYIDKTDVIREEFRSQQMAIYSRLLHVRNGH